MGNYFAERDRGYEGDKLLSSGIELHVEWHIGNRIAQAIHHTDATVISHLPRLEESPERPTDPDDYVDRGWMGDA